MITLKSLEIKGIEGLLNLFSLDFVQFKVLTGINNDFLRIVNEMEYFGEVSDYEN